MYVPWSKSRAFSLLLRSFDLAERSFLLKKFRFLFFLSEYEIATVCASTTHSKIYNDGARVQSWVRMRVVARTVLQCG